MKNVLDAVSRFAIGLVFLFINAFLFQVVYNVFLVGTPVFGALSQGIGLPQLSLVQSAAVLFLSGMLLRR